MRMICIANGTVTVGKRFNRLSKVWISSNSKGFKAKQTSFKWKVSTRNVSPDWTWQIQSDKWWMLSLSLDRWIVTAATQLVSKFKVWISKRLMNRLSHRDLVFLKRFFSFKTKSWKPSWLHRETKEFGLSGVDYSSNLWSKQGKLKKIDPQKHFKIHFQVCW